MVSTVQLTASLKSLESRLTKREIGADLDWYVNRSAELHSVLAGTNAPKDHLIDTEARNVSEIADEIVSAVKWREN